MLDERIRVWLQSRGPGLVRSNNGMRPAMLLLAAVLPLCAEFLRIDVALEGIGCASCIESLESRLGRVRGVERVEIDAKHGIATLYLAEKNRVRLRPLLSRITQDGTKVLRTEVIARGSVEAAETGLLFRPSGLTQAYLLVFEQEAMKGRPLSGVTYEVRGVVSPAESGAKPALRASSVAIAAASAE